MLSGLWTGCVKAPPLSQESESDCSMAFYWMLYTAAALRICSMISEPGWYQDRPR